MLIKGGCVTKEQIFLSWREFCFVSLYFRNFVRDSFWEGEKGELIMVELPLSEI